MKVSVLVLTINRFDITPRCVGLSLSRANYPYELCVTDNGSSDTRIIDWVESINPRLFIKNTHNIGTTQALNIMIAKNPSDAYVFLGNDIEMPNGWLSECVKAAEAYPNAGMIGIDWRNVAHKMRVHKSNGVSVHIATENDRIFGTTFITQSALDKIGSFCEDYGPYGLWDSDCSIRCHMAGLKNMYLHGIKSHHKGADVGENSEYRKMKDESIKKAGPLFLSNVERYKRTNDIYIPNRHKSND